MSRPYNRIIEAVAAIAERLGAEPEDDTGNRLADSLEAISGANIVALPNLPTEDGAYTLTLTVSDGEAVYSWESAEPPTPADPADPAEPADPA